MNINSKMTRVGEIMGYPCVQDLYNGREKKFIVFTYEDERAAYYADNDEAEITVAIQVQLITPQNYNYFADKTKLKNALKEQGFSIDHIQSWLDDVAAGTDNARRTIFSCYYTGADN